MKSVKMKGYTLISFLTVDFELIRLSQVGLIRSEVALKETWVKEKHSCWSRGKNEKIKYPHVNCLGDYMER